MSVAKKYNPVVRAKAKPFNGAALVGINSVVIGWTAKKSQLPKNLLGFAIRRSEYIRTSGRKVKSYWLTGHKQFKGMDGDINSEISSEIAPLQRFRWNDYTLNPSRSYCFEVFPMVGEPGRLTKMKPVKFNICPSANMQDGIGVYVNRGVTAALAYLRRFNQLHPKEVPDNKAFIWLERGLKTAILDFIKSAKSGEALHVGIYEFFDHDIARTLKEAKKDGVDIKIAYHEKAGKKATHENEEVLRHFGLKRIARARSHTKISHNKFIIRLSKSGKPMSVITGTANFSSNAFYFQTNAAMVIKKPKIAAIYEAYWKILYENTPGKETKNLVIQLHEEIEKKSIDPISNMLFSPVRSQHVVEYVKDLIKESETALFMSAPFGVGNDILETIASNNKQKNNKILKFGLVNSTAKKKIKDLNRGNTRFFTPSRLKKYKGEDWDSKAFGAHKIHTKVLVIDPWGDNPAVLFGSANFSKPSCVSNDENTLLIRGDKRLAAILTTEFVRMYDHYRSRYWINKLKDKVKENELDSSSKWIDIYYKKTTMSRKRREREVFSGAI